MSVQHILLRDVTCHPVADWLLKSVRSFLLFCLLILFLKSGWPKLQRVFNPPPQDPNTGWTTSLR
jgi:hypothetical protein